MRFSKITLLKQLKLKWWVTFLLSVLVVSFFVMQFFSLNKNQRHPAQFSPTEMEYAETLLENNEATDPDLEIGSSYTDTLSDPTPSKYIESIDSLLEKERIIDYKRALTEKFSEMKTKRVKRNLARKIIERNRKEGYEVVLDEDFNVVSVKEITPDTNAPDNSSMTK